MPPDKPDPRALAQDALAQLDAARQALTGLSTALEEGVQCPVDPALHRATHRPGTLSRINTDPELRAFILARIDRLTFDAVVSEIRSSFPSDRRVSRSALHRWWHRTGKHLDRPTGKSHGAPPFPG
jgi:hypothetical protein